MFTKVKKRKVLVRVEWPIPAPKGSHGVPLPFSYVGGGVIAAQPLYQIPVGGGATTEPKADWVESGEAQNQLPIKKLHSD
jgi:hypothetical protein